jgi:glucosyl-3-phosphoglycerate phosphatase
MSDDPSRLAVPAAVRTRLILWRHGNTDWNRDGRIQGQTDVPLNDLGREQAAAAATRLAERRPDLLVTSDLSRAAHTAAALAALTGLTPQRDPRLRERGFGQWETLTAAEVAERHPDSYARWRAGDTAPGHGVEPLTDLGKRVAEAVRQAAEQAPGATIVLATHGAAAKHGVLSLLGWPEEISASLLALNNCHWTEVESHPVHGWRLIAHNVGR